jgi:DNA-binding XRE family transcriptional regulator
MVRGRTGLPLQLSSSCDIDRDARARHEQSISTPESNTSARLRGCVRRARFAASLTLEGAALDVGVHFETIKRWESGKVAPNVAKLLDAPKIGPYFREQWDLAFGARRAA